MRKSGPAAGSKGGTHRPSSNRTCFSTNEWKPFSQPLSLMARLLIAPPVWSSTKNNSGTRRAALVTLPGVAFVRLGTTSGEAAPAREVAFVAGASFAVTEGDDRFNVTPRITATSTPTATRASFAIVNSELVLAVAALPAITRPTIWSWSVAGAVPTTNWARADPRAAAVEVIPP